MRNIGFEGGHTIYELGSVSDVILFFECVDTFISKRYPDEDWSLLTDRLYRRYLRQDELEKTKILMNRVEKIFNSLSTSSVNWDEVLSKPESTQLDPSLNTLAEVFFKYFDHFKSAKNSAESFFDAFKIYQPIKIVISDLPGYMIEKKRSLKEYDELNGKPFWLQDIETNI